MSRAHVPLHNAPRHATVQPSPARGLVASSWIPIASLLIVESYASNFDGWGALATAPLFLVPIASSLVVAGYCLAQCLRELRAGSVRLSSFAATSLAALPLLWLMVRRYVV